MILILIIRWSLRECVRDASLRPRHSTAATLQCIKHSLRMTYPKLQRLSPQTPLCMLHRAANLL